MDHTTAYRLWQAPFLHQKFAPILKYSDLSTVRRVLDVGCGPGTNCVYFEGCDYLGIDINERYIEYARRKFRRHFEVVDVTRYQVEDRDKFDFVLLNSLLHHLPDQPAEELLAALSRVLADDGYVHVIDLVLPETRGIPRFVALNDRGDFGRPLRRWRELFSAHFDTVVFEPFDVDILGVSLWNLVYFKGRAKSVSASGDGT
jgi:SAM-dependent methyltransferase